MPDPVSRADSIFDYVEGLLSPEDSEEFLRGIENDPERRAEVHAAALMLGLDVPLSVAEFRTEAESGVSGPAADRQSRWSLRSVAVAMTAMLLVSVAAGSIWVLIRPRPILSDDFEDGWLNGRIWNTPRPGVKELDGYVRLSNRGYLVTAVSCPPPVQIELDWRWIDLAEFPQYTDHLTVVLRTSGTPRSQNSYEATDGIAVHFDAQVGSVHINRIRNDPSAVHSAETLASTDGKVDLPAQLSEPLPGPLAIPASVWHHVRIVDDGETISIYMVGPHVDRAYRDTPLLQANVPSKPSGEKIAIYNRELNDRAPHQSHIDNVMILSLDPN